MSNLTIDYLLGLIGRQLDLSSEREHELLEEMRSHLEETVAEGQAAGLDEQAALRRAAGRFGLEEAGQELQAVHQPWESADAILACALPVVCALLLRWLVFAPDGSALGWPQLLARPALWVVALAALLIPLLRFGRWRYALAGWLLFWALTVLFVVFPVIYRW
ncbi:MAG: permease prefix domain 1-containing protein [Chloroflexi bacterium]|nr:permease prefix domain 1-containing protein [Chloroflexota bacterium]MCI0574900.1 permease prefix domain 1-containing protein [Chloroflexota bacterium]MCI0648402.1 permease prefix domain 1-containing protein [Chloroflexota bacterium]MCI0727523.1 permease prefix domain 1-containing protein [Chloroflexota bacterium]